MHWFLFCLLQLLHIEVSRADNHLDFRLLNDVACELDPGENKPVTVGCFMNFCFSDWKLKIQVPVFFYRREFLSSDLKGFITTLDKTFWQIRHIDKAFLMGDWIKTYFKYSTLLRLHFFLVQTLFTCNKRIIVYCIDFILIWTLIESNWLKKKLGMKLLKY